jgi:hypothetical protein
MLPNWRARRDSNPQPSDPRSDAHTSICAWHEYDVNREYRPPRQTKQLLSSIEVPFSTVYLISMRNLYGPAANKLSMSERFVVPNHSYDGCNELGTRDTTMGPFAILKDNIGKTIA